MGSGLELFTNFDSLEGGFVHNILIKNNVFISNSIHPSGSPILISHKNKTTQNQWITDITIQENVIIGAGDEAVQIVNAKNINIQGNIISNPIRYTAISNPSMSRSSTAFTGSNVSNVTIINTLLYESTKYTSGNCFFNTTATLGYNKVYTDPNNVIQNSALSAFANKSNSAYSIYVAVYNSTINGYYKIAVTATGNKVCDSVDQNTANAVMKCKTFTGVNSQLWQFVDLGNGYYKIINKFSGLALDVTSGSTSNNATICQNTYNGTNRMQWQINDLGNGVYSIVNRNSGKCIKGSTTEGANLVQYTYSSTNASHKWNLSIY
jgi:hypothetical protein